MHIAPANSSQLHPAPYRFPANAYLHSALSSLVTAVAPSACLSMFIAQEEVENGLLHGRSLEEYC